MLSLKRFFRSALCLLLILQCVGLFGIQARAEYADVEDAQNSVVRVFVPVSGGYSIGSGFAVGKEGEPVKIIITNYHVVKENLRKVYVTITDKDGGIPAEVLYKDAKNDFAILELEEELDDRVPITLLSPKKIHKSQDVYCIGFPALSDRGSSSFNMESTTDAMTITKGTVSNPQYEYDSTMYVMSDVKVNGGNSGGPMVDEMGRAIGINTMVIGLDQANNMTLAISIDYVTDVLDDLDIAYIDGNKGKKLDAGESDNTVLIAAACAAAAVAAVVFFVVKRRSPKAASRRSSVHSSSDTIRSESFEVVCQRGPLQGRRIVSSSRVRVGRDPNTCHMVFPDGTPGVSKQHCEIRVQNGRITVQDLNSSYGVFLANGERISGSSVLGKESILLLGSDKVIISVKRL